MRVLVCDNLAQEGVDILKAAAGIEVDVKPKVPPEELAGIIGEYDGIIIRSGTKLPEEMLAKATNLKCIARAGVGVDNVDVPAATKRGIIVMNTPGGNTISTAEHTFALMLALSRNIPQANRSLRAGEWDRKRFTGSQLAGKTIGVIGLGRIGVEVVKRAKAFEMNVIGCDPYAYSGIAEQYHIKVVQKLEDLLAEADYITVHTPLNDQTRGMIGAAEFALVKPGVRVINCARGGIIDEEALFDALESGKVAGAAIDVYTSEPPTDRRLVEHPKVVATPHLAASTKEAQISVAVDAARQLTDALQDRQVKYALNLPYLDERERVEVEPYVALARRLGSVAAQLSTGEMQRIRVVYSGEAVRKDTAMVTASMLAGIVSTIAPETVNLVNAPVLAKERGIGVEEVKSSETTDFVTLVTCRLESATGETSVSGSLFNASQPRIVAIDGFEVEAVPHGDMLVLRNIDRPGLIGEIGQALGARGVNIARMTFGRTGVGGQALTVLNLDSKPDEEVLEKVRAIDGVSQVVALAV